MCVCWNVLRSAHLGTAQCGYGNLPFWMRASVLKHSSVADPGFPAGCRQPSNGSISSRCAHLLKDLYVETKELGHFGGAAG